MGFLKSIFGLIGGIVKAILGVFGVGKKSEFYMELDESEAPPAAEQSVAPAAPAAAPPEPVATPAATVPQPAAPAVTPAAPAAKPAAPAVKPAAPVPSFAANYLVVPTMARRRRPGPSLSPFMAMAKQVKTQ